jgi:hypothetical protein
MKPGTEVRGARFGVRNTSGDNGVAVAEQMLLG